MNTEELQIENVKTFCILSHQHESCLKCMKQIRL